MAALSKTAHDGMEAVAMIRSTPEDEQYDVIISDIRLPDFFGISTLFEVA